MVSVGLGRLLNLVCMDELRAMFWQHRVVMEAPDPHGGPCRVIMGPSHFWMCGCSLAQGVFMSMWPTLFVCVVYTECVSWIMCLRARSWVFVIGCPNFFFCMKVGSPAMMMSMFLERLATIVFGVMNVGSSGKRLSHWFIDVSGRCVGY